MTSEKDVTGTVADDNSVTRLGRISNILQMPTSFFLLDNAKPNVTADDVRTFAASTEGCQFVANFLRIDDEATKNRIVELVRTLSRQS